MGWTMPVWFCGLQFRTFSSHCGWIASRPWTAPRRALQMAALVSVSPPRLTVSMTPSSRE